MSSGVLVPAAGDVPMPAAPELDPRLFEVVPFMRYDAAGRFTDDGKMGIAIIEQKQAAGELIIPNLIADRDTEWFDAAKGTVEPRPSLDVPATLTAAANTETPAFELPACTLTFEGPVGVEYEHPGGPLSVGFTIPGAYMIRGEVFPSQPFTITLTVTA